MFKYLSRFDNVMFSGHKFMENALNHDRIFLKALNDECSTCYVVAEGIIPNIIKVFQSFARFCDTRFSS